MNNLNSLSLKSVNNINQNQYIFLEKGHKSL